MAILFFCLSTCQYFCSMGLIDSFVVSLWFVSIVLKLLIGDYSIEWVTSTYSTWANSLIIFCCSDDLTSVVIDGTGTYCTVLYKASIQITYRTVFPSCCWLSHTSIQGTKIKEKWDTFVIANRWAHLALTTNAGEELHRDSQKEKWKGLLGGVDREIGRISRFLLRVWYRFSFYRTNTRRSRDFPAD